MNTIVKHLLKYQSFRDALVANGWATYHPIRPPQPDPKGGGPGNPPPPV